MDNKTSGGNTKQGKRKRTSPSLVEGVGYGRHDNGMSKRLKEVEARKAEQARQAAAAAEAQARREAEEAAAAKKRKMQSTTATTPPPAATLLSRVNSFLVLLKEAFGFFFRPSPPPPQRATTTTTTIRSNKSVINSIKEIEKTNNKNNKELFIKILQIFDSLHDFNSIFKKNPRLIDKILYDNNISDNVIKNYIKIIFKRTNFEKDLLNNLIQGERGRIQSYTRNANNAGEIVVKIFKYFNNEKVIADANTFFNKKSYCSNKKLKKYAPYFSIATQHDSKGINKCDINYKDDCYKCEIESDILILSCKIPFELNILINN